MKKWFLLHLLEKQGQERFMLSLQQLMTSQRLADLLAHHELLRSPAVQGNPGGLNSYIKYELILKDL